MYPRKAPLKLINLATVITFFAVGSAHSQSPDSVAAASGGDKRILVFNLHIPDANLNTSQKLTGLLVEPMKRWPGIRADHVAELRKTPSPGTLGEEAELCHSLECAARIASAAGYPYALYGELARLGAGYSLRLVMVQNELNAVLFEQEAKFRQGKREAIRYLPSWGAKIAKVAGHPNFPETFLGSAGKSPETSAATAIKDEDGYKGWFSQHFDPHTAHLEGTRISGVMRDTFKLSESPYIVTGNLMVPADAEVLIEPGVTIYVGGDYTTITVAGMLTARGTKEQPIRIGSGKREAANWDWDRLHFKGPKRSLLEYVTLENSNFGVYVTNSAVTLSFCSLQNNAIRAVFVENGDVEIKDSEIGGRQLIGVQVGGFGTATLSRSSIMQNHNAVGVLDFGTLIMQHSRIEQNDRGLVLEDSVNITLEKTRIEGNRIGVLSLFDSPEGRRIRRSAFIGLRGNRENIEYAPQEKFAALLEVPPEVAGIRRLKVDGPEKGPARAFDVGVMSLREGGGTGSGMYGNASIGMEYHQPETASNSTTRAYPIGEEEIPVGALFPQKKIIEGAHTLLSGFATVERGDVVLDGSVDMRYDDWGSLKLDALSLKTSMGPHRLMMGHVSESGSDITLSNRNFFGGKYSANLMQDRLGKSKVGYSIAFGETEKPFDEGERNPDAFGEYYLPGSAVAQELVGVGRLHYSPARDWDLNLVYVHSEDKREGLFRSPLSPQAVTSEPPLVSNMVGMESQWSLLDGNLNLTAEINVGTVDSVNSAFNRSILLWSQANGQSNNSLLEPILQPTVTNGYLDSNLAQAFPTPAADSVALFNQLGSISATQAALRESRLAMRDSILQEVEALEPGIQDSLDASKTAGLRWDDQGLASRFGFQWNVAGVSLQGGFSYVGAYYYTGGNPYLTQDQRRYDLAASRDITKDLSLSTQYGLVVENASSQGRFLNLLGFGEGSGPGLLADAGFQATQELSGNRPRYTHDGGLKGRWNLGSKLELNFDYGLGYKTEVRAKTLSKDTSVLFVDPYFASTDPGSAVPVVYDNRVYFADGARVAAAQTIPDTLASMQDDKDLSHSWGLKGKLRLTKWLTFDAGGKWRYVDNVLNFRNQEGLAGLSLQDSTYENLGWLKGGDDQFQQDYDLGLQFRTKRWNDKVDLRIGWKNRDMRAQETTTWKISNRFQMDVVPRKLKMGFNFSVGQRLQYEDAERYFVPDGNGGRLYFYGISDDQATALDNAQTKPLLPGEPESLVSQVQTETYRDRLLENDYTAELSLRYNLNAKFYLESLVSREMYLRPDQLDQEYVDTWGQVKLFYSF